MSDNRSDPNDLENRRTALINQTNWLIAELGKDGPKDVFKDVSMARSPAEGSERFKAVSCAHEQLNFPYQHAVRNPEFREKWETTKIDGRNGDCLMKKLSDLKNDLQKAGEGNRREPDAQIEPLPEISNSAPPQGRHDTPLFLAVVGLIGMAIQFLLQANGVVTIPWVPSLIGYSALLMLFVWAYLKWHTPWRWHSWVRYGVPGLACFVLIPLSIRGVVSEYRREHPLGRPTLTAPASPASSNGHGSLKHLLQILHPQSTIMICSLRPHVP